MIAKKIIILIALLAVLGAVTGWYLSVQKTAPQQPIAQTPNQEAPVNDPALPQTASSTSATTSPQAFAPSSNPPPPFPPLTDAQQVNDPCTGEQRSSFDCYDVYFRKAVKERGVPSAFEALKSLYPKNDYVRAQCHPITHVLGQEATETYSTVAEAFTHGDSYCWSGYYHGVMEGIVGKIGRSELPNKLSEICASVPGKERYSFDYFNCVHGLGHGVMAYTSIELFDALTLCDRLTGSWEHSSCYGGVFMENVMIDNKNHFTKYLKPKEPLYPCSAVGDQYKNDCYLMQTSYMLKVLNGSFVAVFDQCAKVTNETYRATCYQSLGRDASGRSTSNVQQTKTTCELGTSYEQKSNCVIGATKDFVSYFHSDTQAYQLCDALATDLQQVCRDTTKSYYAAL